MQSSLLNDPSQLLNYSSVPRGATGEQPECLEQEPFEFQAEFEGCMEMYSDAQRVAEYLDAHQRWFGHCAQPMQVEPLGDNGYTLILGRFGALGYEIEPKMSVILHSLGQREYRMETPSFPKRQPSNYEVDYQAWLKLVEIPAELAAPEIAEVLPSLAEITRVQWQLNLKVAVKFPKFIHKLPASLIQSSGDRLLTQIVRQVSPRLTDKVQQDFHTRFDLPIPPKSSRQCQRR